MRLHPLSLPYRAVTRGATAGVSLFVAGRVLGGVDPVADLLAAPLRPALGPALFVVGLVVGAAWEAAYYRRFEYELTDDTLDIRSGVFATRNREIPLGRIQNVDISRSVVQRLLGLAVASFETAGGGETEARLRFVGYDEAKRLQREVQRLTAGGVETTAGAAAEPGAEDESSLFELPDGDLVVLSLVAPDLRVLSALFVVAPALARGVPDSLVEGAALLVAAFGAVVSIVGLWLASAAIVFARYYGFRLSRVGDELRYERGLVQRSDGSIPLDKVQSIAVRENVPMRRLGYAALAVETAGYSPGQSPSGGSEAAVPLARRARVLDLARTVEPFAVEAFERPPKRARRRYAGRYAIAVGLVTAVLAGVDVVVALPVTPLLALLGLVAVPPAAHLKWRHRGYYLGDDHVVTRNGFWRRRTKVVPYYRIQTVVQRATVFQRRWDLATVVADTAGSLSIVGDDAAAVDVDTATAAELRETLRRRMQESRAKRRRGAVGG